MKVAVVGAGYVGLVQAVGLVGLGHEVRLGESNPDRFGMLAAGTSPISEPGLEPLLRKALDEGRLSVHRTGAEAAQGAVIVYLAVPTPEATDGSADLSYVWRALDEIAPELESGAVVVMKSTVPVGTTKKAQALLQRRHIDAVVASNPEFLREGTAVSDFKNPDRIVIGANSDSALEILKEVYRGLDAPIVETDPASAEMIKYGSNAYLATRVAFANSIANICEAVGADVQDVLHGMGHDARIGFHFMQPGPGFGGSCLPKDTRALAHIASSAGYEFTLLEEVIEANRQQRQKLFDKVRVAVGGDLNGKQIAIWGLAFKAGTDDLRESPAVDMANLLVAAGAHVTAHDPGVAPDLPGIEIAISPLEAVNGADALLIATEWPEFADLDLSLVREAMAGDAVIDGRNLLEPSTVRRSGLRYWGVGR
ncbi:MAG: UDP-glucose/GDP-mannose dehydrogenase family protein [Acidimicrobiia bacterium]|nr:UDP-glucose/GDP-mannose dehydrogenase family protein [Acidimicrobiia bacterium]